MQDFLRLQWLDGLCCSFWSASESFGQGATGAVVVDENEEVCVSEYGIPKLEADEVWQELCLKNELGLACAMRPSLAESRRDLGAPCLPCVFVIKDGA